MGSWYETGIKGWSMPFIEAMEVVF